ncbi:MAG: pseudouridine synthase [Lachnospiraceae bacterium]|nr:pseudouridine synthase [Lachnospiraceae bacterium]
MDDNGVRINKYIASCGVCSRRDADTLVERGDVTINGKVANPGDRVFPGDSVKVGAKLIRQSEETVVLAYYKPYGVTCTERDRFADFTVKDAVKYKERVTYAGRLDKESEGLLLLSNNGDLIQSMMKGSNNHEKEYIVRTTKPITEDFVSKMSAGVFLKELNTVTKPCEVKRISKNTFNIVLTQGLNRQIRRMTEACGNKVASLKRVRVLNVTLDGLKPGEYRVLSQKEVNSLCKECGNL